MTPTWKIALVCVGIFAAGGITGGVIGARIVHAKMERRGPEQFTLQQMKRFGDDLALTEQQKQKIEPIVAQVGEDLRRLRRETTTILEQMEVKVSDELTPAQRTKLAELQAERAKRWQAERARRERDSRDGKPQDGPGGPGGPGGPRPNETAPKPSGAPKP